MNITGQDRRRVTPTSCLETALPFLRSSSRVRFNVEERSWSSVFCGAGLISLTGPEWRSGVASVCDFWSACPSSLFSTSSSEVTGCSWVSSVSSDKPSSSSSSSFLDTRTPSYLGSERLSCNLSRSEEGLGWNPLRKFARSALINETYPTTT